MDKIESFNEAANMAKVKAGLKGGNWFSNPVKAPARKIVQGWPMETLENVQSMQTPKGSPDAPWAYRR